jgi:hypothetical protein
MREMIVIAVMALLFWATPSHAYIGPGLARLSPGQCCTHA